MNSLYLFILFCPLASAGVPEGCVYLADSLDEHLTKVEALHSKWRLPPVDNDPVSSLHAWIQLLKYSKTHLDPLCVEVDAIHKRILRSRVFLSRDLWNIGDKLNDLTESTSNVTDLKTITFDNEILDVLLFLTRTVAEINHLDPGKINRRIRKRL